VRRFLRCLVVLASLGSLLAAAAKESSSVVDSGTFEVLVDGKRVATESFKIQQTPRTSISTSTIKVIAGAKAEQQSVLEITTAGELVRYAWKELSPTRSQSTVEVASGALLQRVHPPDAKKPIEVPYMTSPSTFVLDDNFFTHRQLLVWRFLAGSCRSDDGGKLACAPTDLGVLVPAQHVMAIAKLSLVGTEKLPWKGVERELLHVRLAVEDVTWDIWVDPADSYKMLRIVIPSTKTEVIRS